jgi:putative membrane protein
MPKEFSAVEDEAKHQRSSNELAQDRTTMAKERTGMADHRTKIADTRTDLAFQRSNMASDRTLMAVMRTSVSLIGFGFTLYKFFEYMREQPGFDKMTTFGPRNLGLVMVLLGAVMLALSTWQHIAYVYKISKLSGHEFPISASMVGSIIMMIIGFFAVMSILFHVGPF